MIRLPDEPLGRRKVDGKNEPTEPPSTGAQTEPKSGLTDLNRRDASEAHKDENNLTSCGEEVVVGGGRKTESKFRRCVKRARCRSGRTGRPRQRAAEPGSEERAPRVLPRSFAGSLTAQRAAAMMVSYGDYSP